MRFRDGIGGVVGFVAIGLLFAVATSLGMGLIGTIASSPEAASSIASVPYLPLLMLSTGFAPVDDFPGWLQPFVEWQPITCVIDALRAMTGAGSVAETAPAALAWCLGLSVVFAAVGARQVRNAT